ncbi:MAG: Rrf2 family transcriptional regulator [Candidatus Omnitrophota bacterium]
MRITNKGEYGLRLAIRLARNYPAGEPMTTHEIAEAEHLPEEYVQKLLWELLRAGVIESRRGAKGGFRLAKSPQKITAYQIVLALEGESFEVACRRFTEGESKCIYSDPHACGLRELWFKLYKTVNELLKEANLGLLIREENEVREHLRKIANRGRSSSRSAAKNGHEVMA